MACTRLIFRTGRPYCSGAPRGRTATLSQSHAWEELPFASSRSLASTSDLDGLYPTYISDGSAILFWRTTGAHSYPFSIPRMGGTPVRLQPEFGFYFAAISPDGNK